MFMHAAVETHRVLTLACSTERKSCSPSLVRQEMWQTGGKPETPLSSRSSASRWASGSRSVLFSTNRDAGNTGRQERRNNVKKLLRFPFG